MTRYTPLITTPRTPDLFIVHKSNIHGVAIPHSIDEDLAECPCERNWGKKDEEKANPVGEGNLE